MLVKLLLGGVGGYILLIVLQCSWGWNKVKLVIGKAFVGVLCVLF